MTPVKLDPDAFRSRVKYSTTEPLRSLCQGYEKGNDVIFTFCCNDCHIVELVPIYVDEVVVRGCYDWWDIFYRGSLK